MSRYISIFLFFLSFAALATESKTITLGINSCSDPISHPEVIESVTTLTKKAIKPLGFELKVKYLDLKQLAEEVKNKQIDCFVASSGFYRRMAGEGVRDLATAISYKEPDPNFGAASTFITLKNRSDINSVADCENKSVSAKVEVGFAGWQIALEHIFKKGFDPEHFFSKKIFVGPSVDEIITNVLTGKSDIGILPSCFLEQYVLENPEVSKRIKIISPIKSDNYLSCTRTTELYPNWTVATTPTMEPQLSKAISSVLLGAKPDKNGVSWSVATKFEKVDNLLKDLKEEPYAYLRERTMKSFLIDYWPYIVIFLLCVIGLLAHYLVVNRLVRKRTSQLKEALYNSQNNKNIAREAQMKLEAIERLGRISFLSSIIAHELKQPLTAICCYTNGLKKLLTEKGNENLLEVANEIGQIAKRSNEIVDKVRAIAKNEDSKVLKCDLSVLLTATIEQYLSSGNCSCEIKVEKDPTVYAYVDPLEIELVFINLLRNANEALEKKANGVIKLRLCLKNENIEFTCEDNGTGLSSSKIKELNEQASSVTEKVSGLGLGLSIVKTVIKNHFGTVKFSRAQLGGLKIEICFPQRVV